ncbi:ABC transporter substrate-binding protein [Psittacicella hinzii]|nr:ABC transporter substrate-binding protein [Psittacicella hinzii]
MSVSLVQANIPKTLVVGIEDGYYPYEYLDDKGNFTGFDVELIELICQELGINYRLDRGAFESLIPNLLFKKTDVVVSALSITDERKKRVNFTVPYVHPIPGVYLVNKESSYTNINELKTIGVQYGTTLQVYLDNQKLAGKLRTYPSFDTAMLDLKGGRVQTVFESLDVAGKYLNDPAQNLKVLGEPVYSPVISQGLGIAVRKDNPQLLEALNKAITTLEKNGTLKALKQKYNIVD